MKKSWQIELRNWICYSKLLIEQVEELFGPTLKLVAKSEWEQEAHNERKAFSWQLVMVVELFEMKSRQAQLNGRFFCWWSLVWLCWRCIELVEFSWSASRLIMLNCLVMCWPTICVLHFKFFICNESSKWQYVITLI